MPEWTITEIQELVDKAEQSAAITGLRQQMDDDFNKWFALDEFKVAEGHQSYTSPAPLNDFLKVFYGVNKADLTWQIVVPDDAPEKVREAATKGERVLTGVLTDADRRLTKVGQPVLRESLAWYACARGMASVRALIYKGENGAEIDIRPIDPMQVVWEESVDGLLWAAHSYAISETEARVRYGAEVVGAINTEHRPTVTVVDFWDRKINAIILVSGSMKAGKSTWVKEPEPHNLGHVPILVFFAGATPNVATISAGTPTLKHRARSVWSASRKVYDPINKQISFLMDVAEKSVAGTLVWSSPDGAKFPGGDPWAAWTVINKLPTEELKELTPAPAPPEVGAIMAVLDRDKQASTVPYPIGYGIDPGAHSGAALSMMNDNTRSLYGPFTELLAQVYTWLCEEILTQFKGKGDKLELKGFGRDGKFFQLEARPEDIQDDWYIQVKCEPRLPRDEAGEVQMALAASSPGPDGTPLLSRFTAREKILRLQSPDAEKKRIEDEQIERMIASNPSIQIRRVAQELVKAGKAEEARELLATIPAPPNAGGPGGAIGTPQGGPVQTEGAGGGIPPEARQVIMRISQELGITPEQVIEMGPEKVKLALAARSNGAPQGG